ncbi:hypothetical protein FDECE_2118 [Fusarium decemcellulare]|nr:hypothetical protein FDECE_2118 [Fusarium decemcellulare]
MGNSEFFLQSADSGVKYKYIGLVTEGCESFGALMVGQSSPYTEGFGQLFGYPSPADPAQPDGAPPIPRGGQALIFEQVSVHFSGLLRCSLLLETCWRRPQKGNPRRFTVQNGRLRGNFIRPQPLTSSLVLMSQMEKSFLLEK